MVAAMAPCRLYLPLPAACAAGLESSLAQALDQADAACVLLCGDAAPSDTPWDLRLREVTREREVASAFGPAKANETARLAELIAWWAEIFEVPCVPWDVETAEEAESLAGLGADFIALSTAIWQAEGVARRIATIAAALRWVRTAA